MMANEEDKKEKSKKEKRIEGRRRAIEISIQRRKKREQEEEEREQQRKQHDEDEKSDQPYDQYPFWNNASKLSTRHGARNQNRHQKIVKFLLQTFPDVMNEKKTNGAGEFILDVAGGKGELSSRLVYCHQKKVVMVDPRKADIEHCFETVVLKNLPKKWQQKYNDRKQQRKNNSGHEESSIISNPFEELFQQHEMEFTHYSVGIPYPYVRNESDVSYIRSTSSTSTNTTSKSTSFSIRNKDLLYEKNILMQKLIKDATILLGIHSDGATEAIIDSALHFKKPFCVIPCCVFPSFFPNRFLRVSADGSNALSPPCTIIGSQDNEKNVKLIPVRTHEQFCKFLVQKHPRFVMKLLPFDGRNVAIYWDGKD